MGPEDEEDEDEEDDEDYEEEEDEDYQDSTATYGIMTGDYDGSHWGELADGTDEYPDYYGHS
jgi:hypothetical protein